jgi:DNA-binding HxlR family transcriptional regulator
VVAEDGTSFSVGHTDVPDSGFDTAVCPLREVFDRVGDKWSVLVMSLLDIGPRRYSELRRSIDGISQRMLTLTLRSLERDGLVSRTVTPSSPLRVDYALTPVGRTLATEVNVLIRWAERHRAYIVDSRHHYDQSDLQSEPESDGLLTGS